MIDYRSIPMDLELLLELFHDVYGCGVCAVLEGQEIAGPVAHVDGGEDFHQPGVALY